MKSEIKPCPWCGKEPDVYCLGMSGIFGISNYELWEVSCENELCPCQPTLSNSCMTKEEAICEWNTRRS